MTWAVSWKNCVYLHSACTNYEVQVLFYGCSEDNGQENGALVKVFSGDTTSWTVCGVPQSNVINIHTDLEITWEKIQCLLSVAIKEVGTNVGQ